MLALFAASIAMTPVVLGCANYQLPPRKALRRSWQSISQICWKKMTNKLKQIVMQGSDKKRDLEARMP